MKGIFLDDNMSNLTSASNEAISLSSSSNRNDIGTMYPPPQMQQQQSFNSVPMITTNNNNNQTQTNKKKRNLPGNPDPEAEVVALSPKSLMATNRFMCEICNKGFQRDQNLQLHRRGHNLPWKLKQKSKLEVVRKKVYVCPEPSCVHHDPSRALGDLTGIKKHYSRKHGEKKWKCDKCSKRYAVQSDWKAHSKICGTREYRCDCGTLFSRSEKNHSRGSVLYPPVQLHKYDDHVVVDNGIFSITIASPEGTVTSISYNGIDNILNDRNEKSDRGYWDVNWSDPSNLKDGRLDKLTGKYLDVIVNNENQVELSFKRPWTFAQEKNHVSLNIDKRFIVLRGSSGFYSYGIFERLRGWPDVDIYQGRIVFKLEDKLFRYMAVSDQRQRVMPTFQDRDKGKPLAFPEAVLLTHPSNSLLRGEVDDKYQYSSENKDNRVHGWICSDPPVGFWMITPSNEFRNGGPVKQDLTSHAGPVTLSMFFSTHYAGTDLGMKFRDGEPWKKVFGPVFIYLNSVTTEDSPLSLWDDAKVEMEMQTNSWPYHFPNSSDYPRAHQRGLVSGQLVIRDVVLAFADSAFVGLAPPGTIGSWQEESKGYQFWTQTDEKGYFEINNVRPGYYHLYAWVPGYIGEYMYRSIIYVLQGSRINMGLLIHKPPRNGPTVWEIGVPDRTAAEFYVPEPNPTLMNQLYASQTTESFRQYGLWDRYTDLYPDQDLVYTVGVSDYASDWFFAHVNRNVGNMTYVPTTWTVLFDLEDIISGNYTIQLALASATAAELQIRINDVGGASPLFTTKLIGRDNAIARHGIHGLYWLYSINVVHSHLRAGKNALYLTQTRGSSPFSGVMYDYIRLERPPRY